jgi:uncharacterized protein YegL
MNFTLESFYNPYLSAGTSRIDAVLTVTATGDGSGAPKSGGESVVGLILDMSGSMQGQRIDAVKYAARQTIQMLSDDMWFFIIGFSSQLYMISPLLQATAPNKAAADAQVRRIEAGGQTRMSLGLMAARSEFMKKPNAIHSALFLTDGKNNDDDEANVDAALKQCDGVFQCDCRGVGTDWQVKQLQKISTKLLGTAAIIAEPAGVEADFSAVIRNASARSVNDVRLRVWTPKSARVVSVKQMSPEIVVLTDCAIPVDAQTSDYPTGAWGNEARDYYVAMEAQQPGEVGDEMLAARPSLVYQDASGPQEIKNPAARIVATWTDDEGLSARISPQIAHYTGQEELAEAIQQGLEARAQGDLETATRALGRAAKLAQESNNEETTNRLKKVVDIVDAHEGTVRLKKAVNKADEMDLDLGSTRTARAKRPS